MRPKCFRTSSTGVLDPGVSTLERDDAGALAEPSIPSRFRGRSRAWSGSSVRATSRRTARGRWKWRGRVPTPVPVTKATFFQDSGWEAHDGGSRKAFLASRSERTYRKL